MDCVGCEKCRLWGKLQILGLGTALKILFTVNSEDNLRHNVRSCTHKTHIFQPDALYIFFTFSLETWHFIDATDISLIFSARIAKE